MKSLIISPTYNELDNIEELIRKFHHHASDCDILFVDDNSPDGTADLIKRIQEKDPQINLIVRERKLGLGTAYCRGFEWALEHDYERVIQIDADLSHNPEDIPRLLEKSISYDVVIGSRYINGVNVVNWPLRRLILSKFANIYARILTGLPIADSTGGFKCFNTKVLAAIDLESIKSQGYAFQIEMNYLAWIKKYTICEIPIIFADRTVGKSKMSRKIIYEAVWMVPKLALKRLFRMI
ncbi:MAG: polyprenol monophosphomannose synthase [Candidatus Marinimicrobia bacterium]|nr:polyprenol monophosphomannose synthase [Candidatus Neomarinimicrobiota bacterium]